MGVIERATLRILLFDGRWERKPTRKSIERTLRVFKQIVELEFPTPEEDVLFEIEVVVDADLDWGDHENVSDRITERLLRRFEPEYESMIEVEVEVNDAC